MVSSGRLSCYSLRSFSCKMFIEFAPLANSINFLMVAYLNTALSYSHKNAFY
jgi:hypothetical protein